MAGVEGAVWEGVEGAVWDCVDCGPHYVVTLCDPGAVEHFRKLADHPQGTAQLSDAATEAGRAVWKRARSKLPPYVTVWGSPNDYGQTVVTGYLNGQYVQVGLDSTRTESGVEVALVHKSGGQLAGCVLFYYTLAAVDPSVHIPRLLRGADASWEFDRSDEANNGVARVKEARVAIRLNRTDWAHHPATRGMLAYSGATLWEAFDESTLSAFLAMASVEIEKSAEYDAAEPFQWQDCVSVAMVLFRMIRHTKSAGFESLPLDRVWARLDTAVRVDRPLVAIKNGIIKTGLLVLQFFAAHMTEPY